MKKVMLAIFLAMSFCFQINVYSQRASSMKDEKNSFEQEGRIQIPERFQNPTAFDRNSKKSFPQMSPKEEIRWVFRTMKRPILL